MPYIGPDRPERRRATRRRQAQAESQGITGGDQQRRGDRALLHAARAQRCACRACTSSAPPAARAVADGEAAAASSPECASTRSTAARERALAVRGLGARRLRGAKTRRPPARPLKVVVTVGSLGMFDFRRLIERLVEVIPPDAEIVWQTGGDRGHGPADRGAGVHARARAALGDRGGGRGDLHAGIGSALMALDSGKLPILVPRLERHGEHVDDHQTADRSRARSAGGWRSTAAVEDLDVDTPSAAPRAAEVVSRAADPIALPLG